MSELSTVDLLAIPIFSTGKWNGDVYETKDLQQMVAAFHNGKLGFKPSVKAGHLDGQENKTTAQRAFGVPSLGFVSNLRVHGDRLYGDLKAIPRKFAELIKAGAYKRISSEIYWNYKDENSGKTWPRVLKSVAILGADIPALTSLDEIRALYAGGHEFRTYETGFGMERRTDYDSQIGGVFMNAGEKVDMAVKSYQKTSGVSYSEALRYVQRSQPALFEQYALGDGGSGGGGEQYFESGQQFVRDGKRVDGLIREYQRAHPRADYREAYRTVLAGAAKRYEITASQELANLLQGLPKLRAGSLDTATAVGVLGGFRDLCQRAASEIVDKLARQRTRNLPGDQEPYTSQAVAAILRENPGLASMYSSGEPSEGAIRALYRQFFPG